MPTAKDTPITYPTYTNRNLDDGIFEQLMAAVKHHVQEEFKEGRIQADAYSQVYLGLTEACLTQSTQYLLGLLLIDEKRRGQDLQNQKAEYELEVLLPAQYDKILKEIEVMDKQMEKMDAEISLMAKQEQKLDKEMEFLDAKIQTELANTVAGIADANSLIGNQIRLLSAQRLGFAGDLEAKISKMYADYDAVYQSVQELEGMTTLQPDWTATYIAAAQGIADQIAAL